MVEMSECRLAVDVITIQNYLKSKNLLEECGGIAYLSGLSDVVSSPLNLPDYTAIVREKAMLRRAIRACTELVAQVYESEGDAEQMMDRVEKDILAIRQADRRSTLRTAKEMMQKAVATIEDFHSRQGILTGIATGFTDFDKMTGGLQNGDMIVIAARPSMGKTSLALNIAEHVAVDQRLPVGIFSLEMTYESLGLRLLCSRARVNLRNVREGFLAERDFPKLTGAAGKISTSELYVDDSSGLSIMQLRAKARRMFQQFGIKLFVVDYLQLLHSTSRRAEKRQEEIADISSGIKGLAKELNVPVIVLSQLNREIERDRRRPRLSDLRESGAIEQDSDVVGMLYNTKVNEEEDRFDPNQDAIPVNLLIAKQRNGPTGEVELTFLKSYTRFESAARVCDDDVPDDRQSDLSYRAPQSDA